MRYKSDKKIEIQWTGHKRDLPWSLYFSQFFPFSFNFIPSLQKHLCFSRIDRQRYSQSPLFLSQELPRVKNEQHPKSKERRKNKLSTRKLQAIWNLCNQTKRRFWKAQKCCFAWRKTATNSFLGNLNKEDFCSWRKPRETHAMMNVFLLKGLSEHVPGLDSRGWRILNPIGLFKPSIITSASPPRDLMRKIAFRPQSAQ